MKNDLIYLALALITGALIPIQAATNSVFSKSIGNPLVTGLMVFIVGLVGMLLLFLYHAQPFLHASSWSRHRRTAILAGSSSPPTWW